MMGWGSFSSAVGSGGPPRACHGPWSGWAWPPPWADLGVTGVPMGSEGGVFCPL